MKHLHSLPSCPQCGRHELPRRPSGTPSPELRERMVELLAFAREFDAMDRERYDAIDFVDWLAIGIAADARREQEETRQAGQYARHRDLASAG